jgi:hypothetical protein
LEAIGWRCDTGRPRPRRASGLLVSSRVGARLLPPIIVFDPAWAYLALGLARPCGFWVAGLVRVWSAFAPRRSLYGSRLAATGMARRQWLDLLRSRLRAARSCHMCDIEQRRSAGAGPDATNHYHTINVFSRSGLPIPQTPVLMLNDPNTTPVRARARSVPYEERQMTAHQWVLVPLSPSLVTSLARTNTSRTMAQSGRWHTHAPLGH